MARCTAPVHGHRTASGRANCQCVVVVMEVTILIPHILHRIIHYQTVLQVVKAIVAVADKLR